MATPSETGNLQMEPSQTEVSTPNAPPSPPEKIWVDFDGGKTLDEAKRLTWFGPRPSGTDSNRRLRHYIIDRLGGLGWKAVEQHLIQNAPDGREIEFCNVIARYGEPSSKRILIGAHFDTAPTQVFRDQGASNGAANTAVLIELSRTLALDPRLAANVELVFLDGNAPFRELNLNDGLFGSRFYAQKIRTDQQSGDIRVAILLDNIGGPSLNFAPNSNPNVQRALQSAASAVGMKLEPANRSLLADHVPFAQAGIPSITLLDAYSPVLNTADDVTERLSEVSLAKTGALLLYFAAHETGTQ